MKLKISLIVKRLFVHLFLFNGFDKLLDIVDHSFSHTKALSFSVFNILPSRFNSLKPKNRTLKFVFGYCPLVNYLFLPAQCIQVYSGLFLLSHILEQYQYMHYLMILLLLVVIDFATRALAYVKLSSDSSSLELNCRTLGNMFSSI